MSTESETNFEWSVKLICAGNFNVGIASHLDPKQKDMCHFENTISYTNANNQTSIKIGSKVVHVDVAKYKSGDVIRFRFQPHAEKLFIDLVSNCQSPI